MMNLIVSRMVMMGLLLIVPGGGEAEAASCASCPRMGQGPPCQEYWRADAVFVGRVTAVDAKDWSGTNLAPYSEYMRMTARLAIEEAFRGVDAAEVTFVMNDCPYPFKLGERYLVYAHKGRDGVLHQSIGHSRTRPLAEADEDLAYVRGLIAAEPGAEVVGKVSRHSLDVRASRYAVEPLEGVKITLDGGKRPLEAITDAAGEYRFARLAAGTYRLRAEPPSGLIHDEGTIKVPGRGCVPFDIVARAAGGISGRVLDAAEQPVASVPVSLVAGDASRDEMLAAGEDKSLWAFAVTNEQGRFEFSHVAPGRYLLIVNRAEFERSRGGERALALPRLFYPGVTEAERATVIVVGADQKARDYDVRLPPR